MESEITYHGMIEQQEVIDLLENNGIDPYEVRAVHLDPDDSWIEVFVRDEKGNHMRNPGTDDPMLTTLPIVLGSRP